MDGNRRWAKERGLPTFRGHWYGYQKIKEVGEWCFKKGIKILTLFAFSTENWERSKEEVNYLMKLLKRALKEEVKEIHKKGIKVKVIGSEKELNDELKEAKRKAEEMTKNNKEGILNIALNYGGRREIVEAVKKILNQKIPPEKINENIIEKNLYTAGLPDPDLIIRTSGEQRLSGFLLWQSAYSELYFCPKYWPDFEESDLDEILEWYKKRERRFGK